MKKLVTLSQIEMSDVSSVYSGKHGCMCGCNGTYKYSEENRAAASKNRGYRVDDDEVSNLAVKRMVNKFNKAGFAFAYVSENADGETTYGNHVFLETDTRVNVIYFK